MGRNSWIAFGMVAIVIIAIVLVALLILVPQSELVTVDIYDENSSFNSSDYTYTQSKDISEESMRETYSVTTEDIKEGKANKIYKQGNENPFSAVSQDAAGGNSGGSNGSGSGNVSPDSADDK